MKSNKTFDPEAVPAVKKARAGFEKRLREVYELETKREELQNRKYEALKSAEEREETVEQLKADWQEAVAEDRDDQAAKIRARQVAEQERATMDREKAAALEREWEAASDELRELNSDRGPLRFARQAYWGAVASAVEAELLRVGPLAILGAAAYNHGSQVNYSATDFFNKALRDSGSAIPRDNIRSAVGTNELPKSGQLAEILAEATVRKDEAA